MIRNLAKPCRWVDGKDKWTEKISGDGVMGGRKIKLGGAGGGAGGRSGRVEVP
jgi:hypothetical protein